MQSDAFRQYARWCRITALNGPEAKRAAGFKWAAELERMAAETDAATQILRPPADIIPWPARPRTRAAAG